MQMVSRARRIAVTSMLAAMVTGMQIAGAAIGSQPGLSTTSSTKRRQHDRNTGPKHQPRKDIQERLAAAEAKRQRRAARNLAAGNAGGMQFA